jgi:hypothetical protein
MVREALGHYVADAAAASELVAKMRAEYYENLPLP